MKNKNKNKSIVLLFSIFRYLPRKYIGRILLLLILMFIGGLLDFITIGLLFPFLNFVSLPSQTSNLNEESLSLTSNLFSIQFKPMELSILLLAIVIFSSFTKLFIYWRSGRISASIGTKLASEAFYGLLNKEYSHKL